MLYGMNLLFVVVVVFGTTVFGLPTLRDTCDCGNFKWNSYIYIYFVCALMLIFVKKFRPSEFSMHFNRCVIHR